jgi:hypothetical protein
LGGEPEQEPDVQSAAPAQSIPTPHLGHEEPQSTSVSVPFLAESVQFGARQIPVRQTLEEQSVPVVQESPGLQGLQIPPPQSVEDSEPFFTPSLHVGL